MDNTLASAHTALQEAIFRLLCRTAGTKINQRALAAKLGVTPAAVSRALPRLQADGLVIADSHGTMNLKEIWLNREDRHAIRLKRVENLREVYSSGLADYLAERYAGCAIILFGSYSRGEDTARSDIDIAVIGSAAKRTDLASYQKLLEREIRLMYVERFTQLSKEFKESLCNGIVLAGGVEP